MHTKFSSTMRLGLGISRFSPKALGFVAGRCRQQLSLPKLQSVVTIGAGCATFTVANTLLQPPVLCMEPPAADTLDEFLFDLDPELVERLIAASPPRPAAAAAAADDAGSEDGGSDGVPEPELNVERSEIIVGARATSASLGEGTIIKVGEPGSLVEDKVLFECIDKKAAKKRKLNDKTPMPTMQRWIPILLLTNVLRSSPPRNAQGTRAEQTATTRVGPLFPDGATNEAAQGPARAARPSAGEASGSAIGASGSMPQMAAHERARVLPQMRARNQPMPAAGGISGNTRGVAHEHKTKETKVPISKRVADNPNQSLKDAAGSLFCQCCKMTIQNIAQTIKIHVKSPAHVEKYGLWLERNGDDEQLKVFLHDYFVAHPNEAFASVSQEDHVYRYRVVESMLANGVAINKVDGLRPLLERANNSLTASTHLKVYIPKIETREVEQLIQEISGQRVSIIFDGTTRLGEALVILVRWIPADFSRVMQRLVAFRTTSTHCSGVQLAQLIMQVLLTTLKVQPNDVVGGSRDSCSTNGVAMRTIKAVLAMLQDLLCISHTLSHTGEHIELTTLDEFMTPFLGLVQNHPSAKSLWKSELGNAMKGYSPIRWCSRDECSNDVARHFGALGGFLQTLIDRNIGDVLPKKMLKVYTEKKATLEAELAVSLDLEVIIKTVYTLEGDGLLILLARSKVDALLSFGSTVGDDQSSLPNLAAVLRKNTELKKKMKTREWYGPPFNAWYDGEIKDLHRAGKVAIKYSDGSENLLEPHEARNAVDVRPLAEWRRLAQQVKNGIGYLNDRLTGNCEPNYDCSKTFEIYRLAQAFDPSFAAQHVTPAWVDALTAIPALTEHVPALKRELPAYLSKCVGATFDHTDVDKFTKGVLLWWANNGNGFPTWALAMQIIGSFTPNSAAAERVFSMLKQMFGDQQMSALTDMIQAALMLKYNGRKVG